MHATTHRLLLATVLIAALLMSLLPPATPQAAAAPAVKTTGAPTDRLIVKFRQSTDPGTQAARTPAQIATQMSALGGEQLRYVMAGGLETHLLKVNGARDLATMEALARRIAASPDVEYVEPDYIAFADLTPNDLYYATKNWHLQSQSATNYSANLPTAWDITTGSTGITVAVVDTGALLTHEDLAGRHNAANPGYDMISDTARAQDSSGRDADPSDPGTYDFAATTCPTHESSWHGAHVAGTIGASANNGKGVTGINWVSPLLHLRALGRCGSGSSLDIADAMLWAAGEAVSGLPTNPNPARVINLSLGSQNPCSTTYQNTINKLLAKNVVVVVSAGNSNLDASGFSPASCAGVITVGATTWDGSRAYYSNYGTTVEIAAPGGGGKTDIEYSKYIYSTVNAGTQGPTTDAYADYQGTSMAAPHVAGIVSLMLSVNPSLTYTDTLSIIQTTATAFPAGSTCTTSTCGSGIINAAAAVEEAARRVRTAGFASAGQSASEAAGSVVLPITLPTKSNQTVTVPFTVAGTASGGGVDYTLANGTLTYPAGTTTQNITLAITDDAQVEGSETVVITLGTPTNAVLGATTAHTVTIVDNDSAPTIGLSATSVSFDDQRVGTTSAAQTVTLTNTGGGALSLSNIAVSGSDFARGGGTCATTFPATFAAGASCTVLLTFTPASTGGKTGTLTISSNADGSPHSVSLGGLGTAPAVGLSVTSVSFGGQQVGTTSAPSVVTLSNVGTAPLAISAIAVSGSDFARSGGTCATSFPASLAAAASCTVELTFTPASTGAKSGSLTFTSDAAGSPHSISLDGSGVAPIAGVSPASLAFGDVLVGATSDPAEVTLTNEGSAPLAISDITINGAAFASGGGTCAFPMDLEVGASCTIAVVFSPLSTGPASGELLVSTDAGAPYSIGLSGTGTAPALTVAPQSISFDDQAAGTTSAPVEVSITNSGTAPLTVNSIAVNGAAFARSGGTCAAELPLVLAAGAGCTVKVTFAPTAGGMASGELAIDTELSATPTSVTLSGLGLAAEVSLTPNGFNFSSQLVNTTSAAATITLANVGTVAMSVDEIALSGSDFARSGGTCATSFPGTLAAGASCTVELTFTPASAGAKSGSLTFTSDAAGSPHSISLSGTGVAPAAGLSTTTVSFGSRLVGTTSAPSAVVLTNTGTAPLSISAIAVSGSDFARVAGTCATNLPATLSPGASCAIGLTFTPASTGAKSGSLTITTNAANSPHSVALSGTGVTPAAGLAPTSLSFGSRLVGSASAASLVTLSNSGTAPMTISGIAIGGADFLRSGGTCATTFPATLNAGASCTIGVSFKPASVGAKSGTLSVATNAPGSPHTVSLSGTGITPAAGLTPTTISFGGRLVGSPSAASTVTFSNSGTAPMTISAIAISGADFTRAGGTCATVFPATLANGASCTVLVSFKPLTAGAKTGYLTFTSNAAGSPHRVTLTGTGTTTSAAASPTALSFAAQVVGTTSAAQTVTLRNSGAAAMSISGIVISGADFIRSGGTCATTLAAGASCTVLVSFKPLSAGVKSGALTFTSNAAGSPHKVTLGGTGAATTAALTPTALNFGGRLVGTTSGASTVTLRNSGAAAMTISGIAISGADFARAGGTCATVFPATLAAGASCTVLLTFTPATVGAKSGTLTFTTNAVGSPHQVAMTGTGAASTAAISPTSLSFGNRLVGSPSAASAVTFTNTGAAALSISGIAISGGDFLRSGGTCATVFPATLGAGASCTVLVSFKPLAAGARGGTLSISSNAVGGVHQVALSGSGGVTTATLSTASMNFGGRLAGTLSPVGTVTLRNSGAAAMSISGIVISGADFIRSGGTCATTLAAGASCTVLVSFKPLSAGVKSGALTITTNAVGSPHKVALSGSGGVTTALISPTSLSFGSRPVGSPSGASTVTVKNSGAATMTISGIAVNGADFTRVGGTCAGAFPATLAPGASCTVLVRFSPVATGARTGGLVISSNAVGITHTVPLSGSGT